MLIWIRFWYSYVMKDNWGEWAQDKMTDPRRKIQIPDPTDENWINIVGRMEDQPREKIPGTIDLDEGLFEGAYEKARNVFKSSNSNQDMRNDLLREWREFRQWVLDKKNCFKVYTCDYLWKHAKNVVKVGETNKITAGENKELSKPKRV